MGKAEADRDYYADLELEPTADANEIKKAFKKLGGLRTYTSGHSH